MRKIINFNEGWRFSLGHAGDYKRDFYYGVIGKPFSKAGEGGLPNSPWFDDSKWEEVVIPHDWTVKLPPVYSETEHSKSHGYRRFGIEYPDCCIGWYRKKFFVGEEFLNKRVFFEFDGAFREMKLWINGIYVGENESGYIGDRYDITDMLYQNHENIITARLDASHPEGWFYEGCGIYRPVRLILTDELYLLDTETFIRSEVFEDEATVLIDTVCENLGSEEKTYEIEAKIYDKDVLINSETVFERVGGFKQEPTMFRLKVKSPKLWSTDEPHLYKTVITMKGEKDCDEIEVNTGIRTVYFDPEKGLHINGKPTKVKGVCCHQDHAGVGSAITAPLYEYRVKLLKEMGVNAYRCSHNPPSPAFLDICDRLGLLVMDENRLLSSGKESIGQALRLVKRDRNHPSVFIWSIANEEGTIQGKETGKKMAETMCRVFKQNDPTRLTTYAGNNGGEEKGTNSVVDVRGWNYVVIGGIEAMDKNHAEFPNRPFMGTEEGSTVTTRGKYFNDKERGYVSAYGNVPEWGALPEDWWDKFAVRNWLCGSFIWTGFDYRGEPTPYGFPNISSHFGVMDLCGFPKDIYYYYKANWVDEPLLHVCPHWNINVAEGTIITVKCMTNCEHVEIFVNGKSVAASDVEKYKTVSFEIPYQKGTLKAVGKYCGKTIETILETADKAVSYAVSGVENVDSDEKITVFTVKAEDNQGRYNASCEDFLKFEVTDGEIIGLGNGNPNDHHVDISKDGCKLFGGLCSVIVRSNTDKTPVLIVKK